jgi:hypothetical protein
MPTATKLFSALFFAAVAWFAAVAYAPGLPEGTPIGRLREGAAVIGAIVAWRWMGQKAGRGYLEGLGSGIITAILMFLWTNLVFSIVEMLDRTTNMRYRDAFEAVLGVFDLMMQYGALMVRPEAPLILLIGGALGGLGAEFVWRRWS